MNETKIKDSNQFYLLRLLHERPDITQREIAKETGLSLGKVNYCLQALIRIGYIKGGNFSRSNNKLGYVYLLTPKGLIEKTAVTIRFLSKKIAEYNMIKMEIEELRNELNETKKQ